MKVYLVKNEDCLVCVFSSKFLAERYIAALEATKNSYYIECEVDDIEEMELISKQETSDTPRKAGMMRTTDEERAERGELLQEMDTTHSKTGVWDDFTLRLLSDLDTALSQIAEMRLWLSVECPDAPLFSDEVRGVALARFEEILGDTTIAPKPP